MQGFCDLLQIVHETPHLRPASLVVGRAKDRRRMNRSHYQRSELGLDHLSSLFSDAEVLPEQALSGDSSETHDHFGFNGSDLSFEPGSASLDLFRIGFLVYASLAARLPVEMLHNVCNVSVSPIDARFF